ncbi:hypothetical protein F53441_8639 [Fusarium austroafricanum]|uniref:DUF7730 domain-containing protein n=1 Tax=Fusarium austroafricanum TaxID=2364996 RepID=A0A8H4KDQ6_9HYPO|nr:hypothetical protein F53441_8639 [Fusarium austroafricanum]
MRFSSFLLLSTGLWSGHIWAINGPNTASLEPWIIDESCDRYRTQIQGGLTQAILLARAGLSSLEHLLEKSPKANVDPDGLVRWARIEATVRLMFGISSNRKTRRRPSEVLNNPEHGYNPRLSQIEGAKPRISCGEDVFHWFYHDQPLEEGLPNIEEHPTYQEYVDASGVRPEGAFVHADRYIWKREAVPSLGLCNGNRRALVKPALDHVLICPIAFSETRPSPEAIKAEITNGVDYTGELLDNFGLSLGVSLFHEMMHWFGGVDDDLEDIIKDQWAVNEDCEVRARRNSGRGEYVFPRPPTKREQKEFDVEKQGAYGMTNIALLAKKPKPGRNNCGPQKALHNADTLTFFGLAMHCFVCRDPTHETWRVTETMEPTMSNSDEPYEYDGPFDDGWCRYSPPISLPGDFSPRQSPTPEAYDHWRPDLGPFDRGDCSYGPASPIYSIQDSIDGAMPNWKDHIQEMPCLSDPRPRALTPPGFQDEDEDMHKDKRPESVVQHSPWFKVPPYVRQDILMLAFGNKRLHMYLNFKPEYSYDLEAKGPDKLCWQWWGTICNRGTLLSHRGPMTFGGNWSGPWHDDCRQKDEQEDIGIMGWLLSCRQNYAETIELLYSKNTIMMSGEPIMSHMTQILLPSRLAAITDLDIRWSLDRSPSSEEQEEDPEQEYPMDKDRLEMVLDTLSPPHFPKLKRLYVSFENEFFTDYIVSSQTTQSIISRLRRFVKGRPKHAEYAFALPSDIFIVATRGVCAMSGGSNPPRLSYSQAWCSSDGSLSATKMPYRDSYPEPPFHLEDRQDDGFWILEGACGLIAPSVWR